MDPAVTLAELRACAQRILDGERNAPIRAAETQIADAERMAELFQALDEWIGGGGFLPPEWRVTVTPAGWPRRQIVGAEPTQPEGEGQ